MELKEKLIDSPSLSGSRPQGVRKTGPAGLSRLQNTQQHVQECVAYSEDPQTPTVLDLAVVNSPRRADDLRRSLGRSAGVTPRSQKSQSEKLSRMLLHQTHQIKPNSANQALSLASTMVCDQRSESSICSDARQKTLLRSDFGSPPPVVSRTVTGRSNESPIEEQKPEGPREPPICREVANFFEIPRHKHSTWNPQNHLEVAFCRAHFGAFAHYVNHKEQSGVLGRSQVGPSAPKALNATAVASDGIDRTIGTLLDPMAHYQPFRHNKPDALNRVTTTKTCVIPPRGSTAPPGLRKQNLGTQLASVRMKPKSSRQPADLPPGSAFGRGEDIFDPLGFSDFGWTPKT